MSFSFLSKGVFLLLIMMMTKVLSAQKVLTNIVKEGKSLSGFIPKGYDTLETSYGDLNKDKLADCVLILKPKWETDDEPISEDSALLTPRLLLVLLRNGNNYRLAASSSKAILCKSCGGVFGDPFSGVEISNGILLIYHYGGSSTRWSFTHKFRYQQNDFFLIGETKSSYWNVEHCDELGDFMGTKFKDINFVTGQYEEKRIADDECRLLVDKKGRLPRKPLQKLNSFNIEN